MLVALLQLVTPYYESQFFQEVRRCSDARLGRARELLAPESDREAVPGSGAKGAPVSPDDGRREAEASPDVAIREQTDRKAVAGTDPVDTQAARGNSPLAPSRADDARDDVAPISAIAEDAPSATERTQPPAAADAPTQSARGTAGGLGNIADLILCRAQSSPVEIRFRKRKTPRTVIPRAAAMTAAEVAKLLAISAETLLREVKHGRFPSPIRIGRQLRWRQEQVSQFLATIEDMAPYLRSGGTKEWNQRYGAETKTCHHDSAMVALVRRAIEARRGSRDASRPAAANLA